MIVRQLIDSFKATRQQFPPHMLRTAEAERWSVPDYSLAKAQAELYQRLSAVAVAVDAVCNLGVTATLSIKRRSGEKLVDVPNHPFEVLLDRPNPLDSRAELFFGTYAYRKLTGNAYWYLNRTSPTAPPSEVWLIPSWQIKPVPDGRMYISGYEYDPGNGDTLTLAPHQVLHFRAFHPTNRWVGMSHVEPLAVDATAEMAMSNWNANLFGKDNAKIPGALSFADFIPDDQWLTLRDEAKANWGGTNRTGPMMLRGAGAGGVQWVAMALSQQEMEFLAGRQFLKEQFWAAFAPGLSSMLAINANEANARTGKATLVEMAVWPMLTTVAEKLTHTLLPAYGDALVAQYDDIRISDRAMELQEQAEYAKSHTVDEIREKFYEDKPLGDPRGDLLPAQVSPGTPGPGMEQLGRDPVGQQYSQPAMQQMQPDMPQEREPRANPERDAEQDDDAQAKALADLERWQRKSAKRGKLAPFESDAIPDDWQAAVKALGAEDWQRGFAWVERYEAIKVGAQPDLEAEQRLRDAIARVLASQLDITVEAIQAGVQVDLSAFGKELQAVIIAELVTAAIDEAMAQAAAVGVSFDVVAINQAALDWARQYSYELVKGIEDTTRKLIASATQQFIATPGMTNQELRALLINGFGMTRAEMIATTEITRAYAQATRITQGLLGDAGVNMVRVWQTSNDERVCPICGPLHGDKESEWDGRDGPPAHVRCRCWTVLQLERKPRLKP